MSMICSMLVWSDAPVTVDKIVDLKLFQVSSLFFKYMVLIWRTYFDEFCDEGPLLKSPLTPLCIAVVIKLLI